MSMLYAVKYRNNGESWEMTEPTIFAHAVKLSQQLKKDKGYDEVVMIDYDKAIKEG